MEQIPVSMINFNISDTPCPTFPANALLCHRCGQHGRGLGEELRPAGIAYRIYSYVRFDPIRTFTRAVCR